MCSAGYSTLLHELSLADSIVGTVLLEIERNHASRVSEVSVDVGELMQIETDILHDAIKFLMTGKKLKGARVFVNLVRASFSCRKCGNHWDMKQVRKQLETVPESLLVREPDSKELPLHFFPYLYPSLRNCSKCGSKDNDTLTGDDIKLKNIIMR